MPLPILDEDDLCELARSFPSLDFSDVQRQAVLLEMGPRDVQAAPGSGKTTLLAAKLAMLARKWKHPRRGICVLSHTNVARDEIAKRLGATATGSNLLGYPHFVGTIHAFVNQFLALPHLRSRGELVDVVDDDVFAARAFSLLNHKWKLKGWVQMNPNKGPAAIASLRYQGKDVEFGWEFGELPGPGSPSYNQAKEIKDELRKKGVFRYCDMFAFAENLLAKSPEVAKRLSHRFPLVLIDEMQDTSAEQENLLSRIFETDVVMQRFGDHNQRILISSKADVLSFPRTGHLNVSSTKRFGESIAEVVRSVQVHGEAVTANASANARLPVLFLYETASVETVIDAFGKHVLATFTDAELEGAKVKAICARKKSEANTEPGRHLGDYWPAYNGFSSTPSGAESVHRLLANPAGMGASSFALQARVRDVRRAILLAMRAGKAAAVRDVRDSTFLLRRLEERGVATENVRKLCHTLTVSRDLTLPANWESTVDAMYVCLQHTFEDGHDRGEFGKAPCFEVTADASEKRAAMDEHTSEEGGRKVRISLGTIASVKGETHLATLVLEAHAHPARSHDIEAALASIANQTLLPKKAADSSKSLYRNLYVASSRPTDLLCLAMHRNRAISECVETLAKRGWAIVRV
ncbi:MAG TPA: UvrD-helicase domain-containing protein [Ideonella sp.]|uniref:UvrD-helicase domain-containing protein n=1 Tax=Ideonella sp. TaxID=1929293 RepID=UPI002C219122|nr:UvrD-helicase domain-containing protein [Ideonella sp.]HSI48806.1 UvrD-helicase domain-containing protein [Ideonella sp.]